MTEFREEYDGMLGFDVRGPVRKISEVKVGAKNPRIANFFLEEI